jgi:hypothetical protein
MENDAGAIVIKYIPYVVSISSIPRIKLKQPFYTIFISKVQTHAVSCAATI